MRLKSLEIKGFKSFANETILSFNEDVIGIVGPNGSGKSNIVDAVRWVLGEQKSKELRLERMGDVIFNGTKSRKKSGLAQVSLTFDNTKNIIPVEFQNVKISRILYRSGESEYQLNGVTCRLKDITSLFLDTGIGSNSYAIIALGMVDDILADKENARRKMFEQASGISKFKSRKKEALSKLKLTSEDLERIEDLLFEIENNLKTLEKQARRTQRYLNLKEEYKHISIQLAHWKSENLKSSKANITTQIEKESDKYNDLTKELRTKEAELERMKKANIEGEKSLSDFQKEANRLMDLARSKENEKSLTQNKIEFSQRNAANYAEQLDGIEVELKSLNQELELKRKRLKPEEEKYLQLEKQLNELKSKLDKETEAYDDVRNQFTKTQTERDNLSKQKFELEKQRAVNQSTVANIENELQQIDRESKDLDKRSEMLKKTELEYSAEKALKAKELSNLELAESKRQNKIDETKNEIQHLKDELNGVRKGIGIKQNERDLLSSLIQKLEGFPESVKYLSQKWDGKAVLLSDIIDCSDEFRPVLENFLGDLINFYVVDNIQEAKSAISLLSKAQAGKANFLILDQIPVVTEEIKHLPKLTSAMEYVSSDIKYKPLLYHLFSSVYLTDESLESFAYDALEDHIILSQKGDFVARPNSISGGSLGLFDGKKLGRKKNLENVEKALVKLQKSESKLEEKLKKKVESLETLQSENTKVDWDELNSKIRDIESKSIRLLSDLDNINSRIKSYELSKTNFKSQIENFLKKDNEIALKLKEIDASLTNFDKLQNSEEEINKLSQALSSLRESYNALNIKYIQQQNLVNSIRKDAEYSEIRLTELASRKESLIVKRKNEIDSEVHLQKTLKVLDSELLDLYKQKQDQQKHLSRAEQAYYEARNTIVQKEEDLRKIGKQQNELQVLINQLKEKLTDIKFSLNGIYERLSIEFGIDRKAFEETEKDPQHEALELEERQEKLHIRIINYGEINPMAVDAFNEIKERFDTIREQRADILSAKESLLSTIDEIESTASKLFMEAFEQIRVYFKDIFRTLFTEDDDCDLILMTPEDPLNSKIEIVAKPKGKRPKSISLLSGGEKTLTATALLFALYLLKPAPFCIFDEVDAPLDDANILKFNKIIHKFSKDSQFIIVTHNKSTMAEVDVLYGVYMQEQGVSGVAPVDFRTKKHRVKLTETN